MLDQVNVIASDLRRSLRFYRELGIAFPQPVENSAGEMFHAASVANSGALVELDSPGFAPVWNAGWAQRSDLAGRVVLGFRVSKREAVDQRFEQLTGKGYRALQPPFDAFWGARYAIVEDPDGIAIGLMSPIDASAAKAPPPEWAP